MTRLIVASTPIFGHIEPMKLVAGGWHVRFGCHAHGPRPVLTLAMPHRAVGMLGVKGRNGRPPSQSPRRSLPIDREFLPMA